MKKLQFMLFIFIFITFPMFLSSQNIKTSYGLSIFGDLKYGPNFKNFDYANPKASKYGKVVLLEIGTFDSLNPFIIKGNFEGNIALIYDTLTTQSLDEPFSEYGLLAQSMEMPQDRSWIIFNLRPQARWHDNTQVTADDVVFSFDTLIQKGKPFYRFYYKDVIKVEKLSILKVKFSLKPGSNRELPLIIGQIPIISKAYYTKHDFTVTSLDKPLGSGPYQILELDPGRSITYKRDPNYWGKDLPVNQGQYNFDIIKYEYYRDMSVGFEAFKAGQIDFYAESMAKNWATGYKGSAFDKGFIKKEELSDESPTGMQGFFFNTRKDIFKDSSVREALNYAFDFEWTNKNIFYGAYTRNNSYFSNSDLASSGLPDKLELALLEPYRSKLPSQIYNQEYKSPVTDGSGNNRENLIIATDLLKKAGWQIKQGQLVNDKTGKPFEFEFLLYDPSYERIVIPFKNNLQRLGIKMQTRIVDSSQFINRIKNYDFDMILSSVGQSLSPGNEQREFWSSEVADIPGSRNFAGIKDPAVDALIQKIITADSRQNLITACKALDRVLLWGYYVIPNWYLRTNRIAYWDMFEKPKIKPKYSVGFINTWWINTEKYNKVKNIKGQKK